MRSESSSFRRSSSLEDWSARIISAGAFVRSNGLPYHLDNIQMICPHQAALDLRRYAVVEASKTYSCRSLIFRLRNFQCILEVRALRSIRQK